MTLKLYELTGCPYCAKVKDKLEKLDLEYESIKVPSDHDKRQKVKQISGQTAVPVLSDEEKGVEGMSESDQIVKYLEDTYG